MNRGQKEGRRCGLLQLGEERVGLSVRRSSVREQGGKDKGGSKEREGVRKERELGEKGKGGSKGREGARRE